MQWVEIVEIQTRELMYANIQTGECCWEKPIGVPIKKASGDQWWELFDKNTRRFYYYNAATQKTVWHKPQNADIIPLAKLQGFTPNTLSRAEIKESSTQTTSAVAHAVRRTHSKTRGVQNGESYAQKQHTSNHRSSGDRGTDADEVDYQPVKRSSGSNHLKAANIPDLISETKHAVPVPTTGHMPTSASVDNFSGLAASSGTTQAIIRPKANADRQPRVESIFPQHHQSHHQHSYSISAMPTAADYAPPRAAANVSLIAAAQVTPQMNRRPFPRTNPTFFAAKQDGILGYGSGTQRGSSDHLPIPVDFRAPGSNTLQNTRDVDATVNYPVRRFISPNDFDSKPSDSQKRSRFQSDSGIEDVPDSSSYRSDAVVGPTSLGVVRTHVRRVSEPDYVNAQRPRTQTQHIDMSPPFTSLGTMDTKGFSDTTTVSTDWSHDSAIDTSSPVLSKSSREKTVSGADSNAQLKVNSSGIVLFGPSREITSVPPSRGLDDSGKNSVPTKFTSSTKPDVESVVSRSTSRSTKSAVSLMPAAGHSPTNSGGSHQQLAKAQSFTIGVSSAAPDTSQVSLKTGGDAGGIGGGIYRRQAAPSRNNKQSGGRGNEQQHAGSRLSLNADGADGTDSRWNEVIARRESAPAFSMSPQSTPDEFVITNHLNEHRKGLFRHTIPVDTMLSWTKDVINKPMLRTTDKSLKKESIEVFKYVQSYMGDRVSKTNLTNIALEVVSLGWSNRELRDEIYTQLCRQTTDNPRIDSVLRGWELFAVCLSIFPPSSRFQSFLEDYIGRHLEPGLGSDTIKLKHIAERCHRRLNRAIKLGAKRGTRKPSFEEIEQALNSIYHPSMFSSTLTDIMEMQADRFPKRRLPWIQTIMSDEVLRLNGPRTEGIFRLSGDIDEVNSLKARCDQWNPPIGCTDPHTPASLLKLWYRELHEPLIPAELYDECVTHHDDISICLGVINKLPNINRLVFSYLVRFLQVFAAAENAAVTKMDVNNLAMVWAPNCLRCESNDTHVILENTRKEMAFLRTVIINLDTSFMHGVI